MSQQIADVDDCRKEGSLLRARQPKSLQKWFLFNFVEDFYQDVCLDVERSDPSALYSIKANRSVSVFGKDFGFWILKSKTNIPTENAQQYAAFMEYGPSLAPPSLPKGREPALLSGGSPYGLDIRTKILIKIFELLNFLN